MGGGRGFQPCKSLSATTTTASSASTIIACPFAKKPPDTMADSLGDAFQSIAQAVAKMQDAMWAMNYRIEERDKTLRNVAHNIKNHDKKVDILRKRLRAVEPKLTASTPIPKPCLKPCIKHPKGVQQRVGRAFSTLEACACGAGLRYPAYHQGVRRDTREVTICEDVLNLDTNQYSRSCGLRRDVQDVNLRRDTRDVDVRRDSQDRDTRRDSRDVCPCYDFRQVGIDRGARNVEARQDFRPYVHTFRDLRDASTCPDFRNVCSRPEARRIEPPRESRTMGPAGDPRWTSAQASFISQLRPCSCKRRTIHKSLASANLIFCNTSFNAKDSPGISPCGRRDCVTSKSGVRGISTDSDIRPDGVRGKTTPNVRDYSYGTEYIEDKVKRRKTSKGEELSVEIKLESLPVPQSSVSDSGTCPGPLICQGTSNVSTPRARRSRSRKSLYRKRSTTTRSCPAVSTRSVACTACTTPVTPANFCCSDHLEEKRLSLGRQIFKAALLGQTSEIYELLEEGADVNYTNSSKWTPLHRAAVKGHGDAVSLLLDRCANVQAKTSYGYTALHLAAQNDRTARCVSLLVDAGAEIDCWNRSGKSPLHLAAESGNIPAVMVLLSAGASKNARDDSGCTAYDVAKTECIKRLFLSKSGRVDIKEDTCPCARAKCTSPAVKNSVD